MVSPNTRRRYIWPAAWTLTATIVLQLLTASGTARAEEPALADLSLEDLMEIEVTSPSKRAERLGETSAAVYVISNEDIRRSGLNSIPELLRLVPGLHVAQIDASRWAITSRGFNSQFANKLLVLIDGRTVYTHLFSGVFWDVQDVLLEDIDRIEVIRGPGGTLWGANAVNGVINIITKSAKDTHGALAAGGGGTLTGPFGHGRYGTSLGDNVHVRGYVKYFDRNAMETDDGGEANDQWHMTRGGFRTDWDASEKDLVTVQGDYYGGEAGATLLNSVDNEEDMSGGNILGRWRHTFSKESDLSVQLYYDRTERDVQYLIEEDRNTFDVEIEHRRRLFSIHDVVVGFGYRLLNDNITNRAITFTPDSRTDNLVSGFIQDQIPLFDDRVQLTIGSKFESNSYTGFEYQPSIRGLWKVHPRHRLWAAVSRAVRTPSRADDDVAFLFPSGPPPAPTLLISGDSGFNSEKLLAYELGYRVEPIDDLTFDLATYYNDYDDLRTTEVGGVPLPSPPFPPLTLPAPLGNRAKAHGYGVELAADWSVTRWWKLSAWYTFMNLNVDRDQDSTDPTVEGSDDDTPIHQVHFRSRLNLPRNFEFDTNLFWVDNVQNQNVGSYTRLDLRLGWRPIEYVELSLVGQNLTENRHPEFGNGFFSVRSQVPRSVYGMVTLRY
jgi:iron complex outermembrane receptor protein